VSEDWRTRVDISPIRDYNCPIVLNGVVCDGYVDGKRIAVITHFHHDHMLDMERTVYNCEPILMHPTTYAAIIALNRSLAIKSQVRTLEYGVPFRIGNTTITLFDSNHIPGSCQVLVEHDGRRLLYSGDFGPMSRPAKCDYLVLDATHGDPSYDYETDRDNTMQQMSDIILERIKRGESVVVHSSRGTLQEIVVYLETREKRIPDDVQFIADKKEIDILKAIYPLQIRHVRDMLVRNSMDGYEAALAVTPSIFFVSTFATDNMDSRFVVYVDRYRWFGSGMPGVSRIKNGIRCNLSSHSSYGEIIRFVRDAGPKFVLTDSSRSSCAGILAERICSELGIDAQASGTHMTESQ